MSKGTPVIDRCLPALPTKASGQLRTAIFTVRQWRPRSISSPEETFSPRFIDGRDRSIALDQFRRFVGHSASLEKLPANVHFRMSSVRRL
jgi:hypothetical protein